MQGFTALDTGFAIWDNAILMGFRYNRFRRSAFHAAHAAVAAKASFDPSVKPDSALISDRQAKRPNYKALATVPADWDYIVLDVPFGKRGSTEVRQWAKSIGAITASPAVGATGTIYVAANDSTGVSLRAYDAAGTALVASDCRPTVNGTAEAALGDLSTWRKTFRLPTDLTPQSGLSSGTMTLLLSFRSSILRLKSGR